MPACHLLPRSLSGTRNHICSSSLAVLAARGRWWFLVYFQCWLLLLGDLEGLCVLRGLPALLQIAACLLPVQLPERWLPNRSPLWCSPCLQGFRGDQSPPGGESHPGLEHGRAMQHRAGGGTGTHARGDAAEGHSAPAPPHSQPLTLGSVPQGHPDWSDRCRVWFCRAGGPGQASVLSSRILLSQNTLF